MHLKVHFLYNMEIHRLFGLEYCIYVYVSSITTTNDSACYPTRYKCPVLFCTRKTAIIVITGILLDKLVFPLFSFAGCQIVNVHCSLVKEDLIKLFADPTVLQQELDWRNIDNYGRQEEGVASAV